MKKYFTFKFFVVLFLFIFLIVGVSYLYTFVGKGTIRIILPADGYDPTLVRVYVDDKAVTPSDVDTRTYTAKVANGTHTVQVNRPGQEIYTNTVSIGFRKTSEIVVEQTSPTETTVVAPLVEGFKTSNEKYFEKRSWVVFNVLAETGEGALAIARYSESSGSYEIIAEGTDFDMNSSIFNTAPTELVEYVKGLQ